MEYDWVIYSGIFLAVNAALIYAYFKFLKFEGKKRLVIFLLGFPIFNFLVITVLLLSFHSQYKAEFSEPLAYIEYEITDDLKKDSSINYQRSGELLEYLNEPKNLEQFKEFDLPIDVNKSQEFIVDKVFKVFKEQDLKTQIELLLADPFIQQKAFFACLPNVKQGKLSNRDCEDVNYEKTFAFFARVILVMALQGKQFQEYEKVVQAVSEDKAV